MPSKDYVGLGVSSASSRLLVFWGPQQGSQDLAKVCVCVYGFVSSQIFWTLSRVHRVLWAFKGFGVEGFGFRFRHVLGMSD